MKTITHYLDGEFLRDAAEVTQRPADLTAKCSVYSSKAKVVRVQFSSHMADLLLLPEEAKDLANSLFEMAREAEGDLDD